MAVCLAACATFTFREPAPQLVGLQLTALGLEGGALRLLLDVHNPNAYDLRTTRIAVGVDLEGTHFGDVELAEAVVLPARDTTRVELPLRFSWAGVGTGARSLLGRGAVRYTLTGRLRVATPIGDRDVPVRTSGEVALTEVMR